MAPKGTIYNDKFQHGIFIFGKIRTSQRCISLPLSLGDTWCGYVDNRCGCELHDGVCWHHTLQI